MSGVKTEGKVRVAAVQFGAGQDVEANLKTALRMIDQAATVSPDLLVLPEFCNHCSWYDDKPHCFRVSVPIDGPFLKAIAQKAKDHKTYIVINVTLQRQGDIATGTSLLFGPDGNLVGEKDKEVLMGHENHYLEKAKAPGPIVNTPIGKLGLYSCMDGVIMETTRSLSLRGGQILCNSLNSFAWDEGSLHIPVRAAENKVFIVAANKVGPLIPEALMAPVSQATKIPEHHLHGSGESQIVAPDGTVLAMAPRSGEAFIYADIDPSEADDKLRPDGTNIFHSRRPDLYKPITQETPIAEPPALADNIKSAVYQPKSDGVAAIEEVASFIETKANKHQNAHVIVLPELFCFEKASVRDLPEAVTRSQTALTRIQQALTKANSESLVITTIVESSAAYVYHHVGVAISKSGIVLKQQQIHRNYRHAWATPGNELPVSLRPWGNLAIVVGDDSIYPETFRLLIFKNANFIAVPTHITEQWELTTGLLERSAENRVAVVVSSRKSLGTSDSCCRIFNPFVDFTLMVPWPNRPFDGLISQPRIATEVDADGVLIDLEVNIKGSQNKVISALTHLVLSRPIHNLEALIKEQPGPKRSIREPQNLIEGKWVIPILSTNKILTDASTGHYLGWQKATHSDDVERALAVAWKVHESGELSGMSKEARVNALLECAQNLESKATDIAQADSIQTGSVINQTGMFAKLLGFIFKECAKQIGKDDFFVQKLQGPAGEIEVLRKPWGPALCVTPWNAPAPLEVHKIACALATGCPVILKPSEWSHASSQFIADAILASSFPKNAFQIVHGDSIVGAQLVKDSRIKCVSFTGGLHGGRAISAACAYEFKPIQLELGGNNAFVVFEDANLDKVATGILQGLTTNNGQWCRAIGRIIIHKSIEKKVVDKVLELFSKIKIGDALSTESELGPIAHPLHLKLLKQSINALKKKGGRVLSNTPLPNNIEGYFLAPTLITGCKPEDTLDEIFGPVAVVHTFETEAEALKLANQTPFGLSGYCFGGESKAFDFSRKLNTGEVKINGCKLLSLNGAAPRPAWGLSGYGAEGAFETLDFFCGKSVVGAVERL